MNVLVVDYSTVKGHHSLYINGVIQALESVDEPIEIFLLTADNQQFEFQPGMEEKVHLITFPRPLWSIVFARSIQLLGLFHYYKIIQFLLLGRLMKKHNIHQVFFPHLDSVINRKLPLWAYRLLGCFWSGIFIKPYEQKGDQQWKYLLKVLNTPLLKKVIVLDELLHEGLPAHPKLDHIRELLVPDQVDQKYCTILNQMKGDRVGMALVGSLVKRKQLIPFLEWSNQLPPENFFIILAGHFPAEQFSLEETDRIDTLLKDLRSKQMIQYEQGYIKDEATFNAIYQAADMVWLNYLDHPYTSNAIINAIHFRCRVITHQSCDFIRYVGQKYQLPLLTDEELSLEAIQRLGTTSMNNIKVDQFQHDYSFDQFADKILSAVK